MSALDFLIRALHSNLMQAVNEVTWLILSQSPRDICLHLKTTIHNCCLCSGRPSWDYEMCCKVLVRCDHQFQHEPGTAWLHSVYLGNWSHQSSSFVQPTLAKKTAEVLERRTQSCRHSDMGCHDLWTSCPLWDAVCGSTVVTMFFWKVNVSTFLLGEEGVSRGSVRIQGQRSIFEK